MSLNNFASTLDSEWGALSVTKGVLGSAQGVLGGGSGINSLAAIAGLQHWVSAKDPANLTVNAGVVSIWHDMSQYSTINGLQMPGVTGANRCYLASGSNIGTNPFTRIVDVLVMPTFALAPLVCASSSTAGVAARSTIFDITALGYVNIGLYGDVTSKFRYDQYQTFNGQSLSAYIGQRVSFAYTRSGTTVLLYFNGVLQTPTSTNNVSASPPAYSDTITSTYMLLGYDTTSFVGNLFYFGARGYSVALDAAGILADYQGTIQANNVVNLSFAGVTRGTNGTDCFTCASGQTVTIDTAGPTGARIAGARDLYQGTGANQPAYDGTNKTVTGDGTNDLLKSPAFTLTQPSTVLSVINMVSWTDTDVIFDGFGAASGSLEQSTTTPQINLNAGSSVAANTNLAVAVNGVVACIFNAASSSMRINYTAATTGNAGAGNMGGVTLFGAGGTPAKWANVAFKENAVYSRALTPLELNKAIRYLVQSWGVVV